MRTADGQALGLAGDEPGQADGAADGPSERWSRLGDRILTESHAAGLGPGGQLPTERELATTLGVTRSAVRHALAALAARGMLSREVGRGTFLRLPPPQPGTAGRDRPQGVARPGDTAGDFAPADVMTIRRLFEPPAMPLVVAWATAADLAEMDRCLAGGDRAADYAEFEAWDVALHRAIMAASHSPLLVTLYGSIETARHGQVWGDLKRRSASAERRQQYQADHHAIVSALRARDSASAVDAMRVHLARVAEHLNATDPAALVSWR